MAQLQDNQTTTQVSGAAIVLGALIGVGFCIALGAFGGAISMGAGPEGIEMPEGGSLALLVLAAVALLDLAYFMAGFIASKVSHQQFRFDSILHSLGTWATMSILLVLLVAAASSLESARGAVNAIKAPSIVTSLNILSGKATTKIQASTAAPDKPTTEDRRAGYALSLAWWIACVSLIVGAGASVGGGLLGRSKTMLKTTAEKEKQTPEHTAAAATPSEGRELLP